MSILNLKYKHMLSIKYYKNIFSLMKKILIGKLLKRGKKLYAWRIFLLLQYMLKQKIKKSANFIMLIALLNSLVKIHFIKIRMGSVKKEIPIYLSFNRQIKFTLNFWLKYTFKGYMGSNIKALVKLIGYSYKKKGMLIKKNYQNYKKAIDSKVFLRFLKK